MQTGDALLAPAITRRLVERFARRDEPQTIAPHRDLSGLTPRELEVLRLLATGLSNAELASRLFLSPTTVKTHLGNLYETLEVSDRAAAVAEAMRRGLIT